MKRRDEILLAVDTAGRQGSVALARTAPEFRVLEVVPLAGGSYSAQLMPRIAELLARQGLEKEAITALAAASGPGSFTGLRVGLSTVKALAEVLPAPIAAVSVLQALAWLAPQPGRVLALLDAGRKQVFAGEYERLAGESELPRCRSERLLSEEELRTAAHAAGAGQVVTADEAIAGLLAAAGVAAQRAGWPDAGVIARLGWAKIARGETVAPEALDANYIRRSDAEIFAK